MEEMKDIADNHPGFVRAMWCGDLACEEKIKEDAGLTSRCIPLSRRKFPTNACAAESLPSICFIGASSIKGTPIYPERGAFC